MSKQKGATWNATKLNPVANNRSPLGAENWRWHTTIPGSADGSAGPRRQGFFYANPIPLGRPFGSVLILDRC